MIGTTIIKIGGMDRPVKFGTNQTAIYCDLRGKTLAEYQHELTDLSNVGVIRDLIYSALFAGCKADKIDIDFDNFDVGEWIDELKPDDMAKIFDSMAKSNDGGGEPKADDSKKK
jgi:hypothetical protein